MEGDELMASQGGDDRQVRPFAAIIQEHNRGKFHSSLSETLADLTAAVTETGKAGRLTLTIDLAPLAKGAAGALKVSTKVAVKAPQHDEAAPTSVFFADKDGNLVKDDPNQTRMDIRAVAKSGEVA